MPPPSQPPHPALQPQLCLAPSSLRAFLRLSRAAIDDPISQHLSSLSNPSAVPFDTSTISASRTANPRRSGLPSATCAGFVSHTLFPAWAARARVLEYCADVATTEAQREAAEEQGSREESFGAGTSIGSGTRSRSGYRPQWGGTVARIDDGGALAIGAGVVGPEATGSGNAGSSRQQDNDDGSVSQRPSLGPDGQSLATPRRPRVVGNERLDPYSARDYSDESPAERLARVVREERSVEAIVRSRSWAVVMDRCGSAMPMWQDGMKTWETETAKANSSAGRSEGTDAERGRGSFWAGLWGR